MIHSFRKLYQQQSQDQHKQKDPPPAPPAVPEKIKDEPAPAESKPELAKPPVKNEPKSDDLLLIKRLPDGKVKITFAGRAPIITTVEKQWCIIRDYYTYKILPTDPEPADYYKLKDHPGGPPRDWWNMTVARLHRQYPLYTGKRLSRLAGEIWDRYSVNTKKRLISRMSCNKKRRS